MVLCVAKPLNGQLRLREGKKCGASMISLLCTLTLHVLTFLWTHNIHLHFFIMSSWNPFHNRPTDLTYSISWLLMSWQHKAPGHQQPWHWASSPRIFHPRQLKSWPSVDQTVGLIGEIRCNAIHQGPVSLRLMTSQFKDIVTYTQK